MRRQMATVNPTPDEILRFQKSLLNLVCKEQALKEEPRLEHSARLEELALVLAPKRKTGGRRSLSA
jgi:hypothetical protein